LVAKVIEGSEDELFSAMEQGAESDGGQGSVVGEELEELLL
jgi:hypothetical protein